jgi:chemotaxis methyl-accepting protein methylase
MNTIEVSKYDASFLEKSMHKRAKTLHCISTEDYISLLQKNQEEKEIFLNSLKIGYSQFFRNSLTFSVLERLIIPLLPTKRKEIRIWSSACASGQEAFSMAILMEEFFHDTSERISYRIFATDFAENQIEKALSGIYHFDSMQNVNLSRLTKWFTQKGDYYEIHSALKEQIDFSVFDLFDERHSSPPRSIFGNFDIVFCANLLFYYKEAFQNVILTKINDFAGKRIQRNISANSDF